MSKAYDHLAEWFEFLNDDCDYSSWSQYFIRGLAAHGAGKTGLELGCGSGAFARALTRAGYEMTGADVSLPMLDKAARLARAEGLTIPFLQLNAAALKLPRRVDFILAPNDCYNYLPQNKLASAFSHAANCLKKGGIFWFDVSSPYKIRNKIANNILADDRDEVTYLSFNHLYEDRVEMDVTLFVREGDGRFSRYDERHVQYIHEEASLRGLLEGAGFTLLACEGHLGEERAASDRLNFICRKE